MMPAENEPAPAKEDEIDAKPTTKSVTPAIVASEEATVAQERGDEPEVDDFGLPIRKPRRRFEPELEQDDEDADSSDGENFVDAPSNAPTPSRPTKEEDYAMKQKRSVAEAVGKIEGRVRREREVSADVEERVAATEVSKTRSRSRSKSVARSVRARSESVATATLAEGNVEEGKEDESEEKVEKSMAEESIAKAGSSTDTKERPKTPTQITPTPPSLENEKKEEDEGPVILHDAADRPREDPTSPTKTRHTRNSTKTSINEWSHMASQAKQDDENKDDEEDEWQTMPAYAPFDIYDDDNKLIAREAHDYEEDMMQYGTLGGAGKGYTRVQLDEDAQSQTSMDDNTAYLFKDAGKGTAIGNSNEEEDEEALRDAKSQMNATKELLTEGQRIAYVGTVRLTMIEMHDQFANLLEQKSHTGKTKKSNTNKIVRKAVEFSAASTLMWSQKVMIRLYAHMEIGQDEQIMIEQLASHGVKAEDLVPALMINARVKNPVETEDKKGDAKVEVEEVDEDEETKGEKEKESEKEKNADSRPSMAESRASESSSIFSMPSLPSITSPFSGTSTKRQSVSSPKPKSVTSTSRENVGAGALSPPLTSPPLRSPSTPGYIYDDFDERLSNKPKSITSASATNLTPTPSSPNFPAVKSPSEIGDEKSLDIDIRWTVLCDLFLLLIADSTYDSRSRKLLERVGESLSVSWLEICRFEKRVTDALEMQESADKENWNEDEHLATREKEARKRRLVVMGLATVGGGLVIGLSAGLLAPVIGAGLAAGFTTIGVAGTSGFLAGAGGAAIVTTTGVVTGGTIGVRAANRRTGAVKTFEYRPLHNNKRVNLIVTIAGWMNGKVDDVRLPFSTVDPIMGDIYSIYWEPEMLQSMGQTISILATEALTQTLQQVLGSTILVALMAALQLPVLLTKLAYLIDNPWNVSLARADLAGLILADSLIDRNLGSRPITLVGFSLGARVIYSCLRELARKGQVGLIQNVYIFGTPVIANRNEFLRCRSVVAGRFLNGYATNDWILAYLFRITGGGIAKVAGLTAIDDVPDVENVNVTEWVPGHMAYRAAMPRLLREVGWEVESDEFTEIEDPDPDNHEKRQRELINEIEEARKQLEEKQREGGGKKKWWKLGGGGGSKKRAEKKEWETYDERSKVGVEAVNVTEEKEMDQGMLEKQAEGVLFDIEAIRKEVKELAGGQEIEIREIQSTLPPMRITMDATASKAAPTPEPTPPGLRSTKSHNDSIGHSPSMTPSTGNKSTFGDDASDYTALALAKPAATNGHHNEYPHDESEITMSFGSPIKQSFDHHHNNNINEGMTMSYDMPARPSHNYSSSRDRSPAPEISIAERPQLHSHPTAPMPAKPLNMSPEYNAWGDEDDFGQEKEIKMTFA